MNVNGLAGRVARLEQRNPAAVAPRVDQLRYWSRIFAEVRSDINRGEIYEHLTCGAYQGCHHWPRYRSKYPKRGYCDTSSDPLQEVEALILSEWGHRVMGWTVPPCERARPRQPALVGDDSEQERRGRMRIAYLLSCLDELETMARDELATLNV